MNPRVKIGIIICDRYRTCAGGKCLRAMREKEGAFDIYAGKDIELVGYTTCGGCPGGNIEYAPEELKRNGAELVHLATGMIVGYPPCPYIKDFVKLIEAKFGMKVVVGTHPIPEKYYLLHKQMNTWNTEEWERLISPLLKNQTTRLAYD
jgi:predicted metal-binding protein